MPSPIIDANGCATCGVPLGTKHTDACRAAHGIPTPCCGNFDTCQKPCTPRGTHWQDKAAGKAPDLYDVAGYERLASVLVRAHAQAASGKGAERHAQGQPFEDQPMQLLIKLYGPGFALGQAAKKAQESQRLPRDRAIAELLGSINYLAGAVIALENSPATNERNV